MINEFVGNKHYVGEAGTDLILDTGMLIGSVTAQHIKYLNPASTEGTFTASLYSSYSELAGAIGTYLLKHTLATTDFSVPGVWKFQAYVAAVDGTWFGETTKLTVYDEYQ